MASRNNEIIHTLALILIKNEKYKYCENLLSPTTARTDADVRHHYYLGEVHERLGNSREARFHYRQSLLKSSSKNWKLPLANNELEHKIQSLQ